MGKSDILRFIRSNDIKLLSKQGWHYFGQLLIECTYLQPFKFNSNGKPTKERVKINTHNGQIEREVQQCMLPGVLWKNPQKWAF